MAGRLSLLSSALWILATAPVAAQEDAPRTTCSAVIIAGEGATLAQLTTVSMGLRRGAREVEGVRFRDSGDILVEQDRERTPPEGLFAYQDSLDEIAEMVRSGNANAAEGMAREAIEFFEASLGFVTRRTLVDAYLLWATANCQRNRRRECVAGFDYVVRFRENAIYDPERYPPDYEVLFAETQLELVETGTRGSIRIETIPEGAEVFVDGVSYGPSPATAEGLLVGDHYVTVKAFGYEKAEQRVTIEEAFEATANISLVETRQAQLLRSVMPAIRAELGVEQATRDGVLQLRAPLSGIQQVMIAVVTPRRNALSTSVYLYDLRTRFLLSQRDAQVPSGPDGADVVTRLATELYEGVDLSGRVAAPDEETVDGPGSIFEQWWFYTVVGAVLVAGGVTLGVVLSQDSSDLDLPDGVSRIQGIVE
ncbi:MAG: PEGA domain-containing protein [Myxococcota bacterium]